MEIGIRQIGIPIRVCELLPPCDCAVVLLDLSAAFDIVDRNSHNTVSVLSRRFGVANTAVDWCSS